MVGMLKVRWETNCNKYVIRFHHEKMSYRQSPLLQKDPKVCVFLM